MQDKFTSYYSDKNKVNELSEYVHLNFRLIHTKMVSEMRRKLNIKPDLENSEGYVSLLATLQGRLFNEMVYSMCGLCQSVNMKFTDIIPEETLRILLALISNKNPLNGNHRPGMVSQEAFNSYYLSEISSLREITECSPQ